MIKDGREGLIIRQRNSKDIVRAVEEILQWKKKDVKKYAEKYQEGTIRVEVNNRVVKNMILGAFSHMALRWIFAENESQFDKTKEINEVVNLIVASLTH